jgi:negative regulator of sigma-B (phosphoserine phosphatase)
MTGDGRRYIDWAWAGVALAGDASGDVHVVAEFADGVLVGVIDGLGHGIEAAVAARTAAGVLASCAGEPLAALVERCHEALRSTRGAVMSLCSFDARGSRMTWAGVGNVEAFLVRASPGAGRPRESIVLRGGIVGYHLLPALRPSTVPVFAGDTLIMATDGVGGAFGEGASPGATPQALADAILARHARGTDDALVLVARYLGAPAAGEETGT